ncbi:MAG: ROK family protein [Saprospiraceae bacterium]|nr:ROK family protein [Saprospiraceae bacterium]MDW8485164.1 ROK family protein [Saprospiraceae bacterium]
MYRWGIDLGGTKIEGVVIDGQQDPRILARYRIPTEAQLGYDHILDQVALLVEELRRMTGLKPSRIGVGHPGTLDPQTGLIKNANTTALIGKPFDKDLCQRLGVPVKLSNDANCFAVAEAYLGAVPEAMPQAEVVFGVIMGTGVGGGIVVHGQVIHGRQGIAGEWGHNFLDEEGGPCYCGKIGCVETLISGPALERFYYGKTGEKRRLSEIATRATTGTDPAATDTIDRLVHYFGKAIAVVINILDPDAIVLGGGVGNIERLYSDGVAEAGKHLFNPRIDTVFLKPKLGDSAGVFGAAFLL